MYWCLELKRRERRGWGEADESEDDDLGQGSSITFSRGPKA